MITAALTIKQTFYIVRVPFRRKKAKGVQSLSDLNQLCMREHVRAREMVVECIKLPSLGPGPLHMMDHLPKAKHLISLSRKINKLRDYKEWKGKRQGDGGIQRWMEGLKNTLSCNLLPFLC